MNTNCLSVGYDAFHGQGCLLWAVAGESWQGQPSVRVQSVPSTEYKSLTALQFTQGKEAQQPPSKGRRRQLQSNAHQQVAHNNERAELRIDLVAQFESKCDPAPL